MIVPVIIKGILLKKAEEFLYSSTFSSVVLIKEQ